MDDLRETCEEMSRMLYHRSSSTNGNYVNGGPQRRYNDNHDAPNRFRNNGVPFRNGQNGGQPNARTNRYYNKPVNGNDISRAQEPRNYGMFNTMCQLISYIMLNKKCSKPSKYFNF